MNEKRRMVKLLMSVLGDVYWSVNLKRRLKRLKLCIKTENRKYDYRYEAE